MPDSPHVSIAVDAATHVATLALRAPAEGVSRGFVDALVGACEQLRDAIDRVHAVVVTCAMPDGDRAASDWAASDWATGWDEALLRDGVTPFAPPPGAGFEALAALPQPTVAAVEGRAHSAGLELALACDIRVCGDGASFAMPETGLGLVPMGGGTQRLPRAVGRAHGLRLLLTGEQVDATEALRIGLVSRVVPVGEAAVAAAGIASAIAAKGPIATRYAKEAVARGLDAPLQQGLRAELDMTVILQSTADRAEGVQAFVERREPHFEGR